MTSSIKELYAYAVSEGEGVGTAYEYFVKRRVMRPILSRLRENARVLVAGLPEKYGTSLDFVLAAWEARARVLVVDDRDAAIDRARGAVDALKAQGRLGGVDVEYKKIAAWSELPALGPFDAVLSCEVVQRIAPVDRENYMKAIFASGPRGVVFVPNSENGSHTKISGLSGLDRAEMKSLFRSRARTIGFVDLPPFPPGITRSADQRTKASSGLAEAIGMWGLQMYSASEPYLPDAVKKNVAHIVYATWIDG